MSAGEKMELSTALLIGEIIKHELLKADAVEIVEVVGSVRRKKVEVGDVEILYIPKFGEITPAGCMFPELVNLADQVFEKWLDSGLMSQRLSSVGRAMWGEKNKLALYNGSYAVDLFSCSRSTWVCNLVCRTGSKELNREIATKAQSKGWKWRSTGEGFENVSGEIEMAPKSEKELFEAVGLQFLDPSLR